MNYELEIGVEEAKEMAKQGRQIFVFVSNPSELEFVGEMLGAAEKVHDIDFGDARQIIFKEGEKESLEKMGRIYRDGIIVCPHGRSSLKFASALSEMGIKAYSLKGGIEGMRSRA